MNPSVVFRSVLLVEDEESLASSLSIALKKFSITATVAKSLMDAKAKLEERDYELILLDRNLPDGDGLSLVKTLRSSDHEYLGTILMLTALGETPERVKGLLEGADDYLPKPFSWEELEARIVALSRTRTHAVLSIKEPAKAHTGWNVEVDRIRIRGPHNTDFVELTPLEFKLATKLINAGGSIVSREELLKDVWGFTLLPKTRTVDHFLGRLRKHFEASVDDPKHFLTVRGAGYRFEP